MVDLTNRDIGLSITMPFTPGSIYCMLQKRSNTVYSVLPFRDSCERRERVNAWTAQILGRLEISPDSVQLHRIKSLQNIRSKREHGG
jgi:hypothetical protein